MRDFWVGDYRVDVPRAQVVANDDIISLEPRVLKVLLILAKSQGEVVTHEELLTQAWPNMVVAPNALQRCIGQLRKALGDDAKQQKMIATHPKVGYSLVAKVAWSNQDDKLSTPQSSDTKPKTDEHGALRGKPKSTPWLLGGVVLMVLLLFSWLIPNNPYVPPLTQLTPLTSTNEKEYFPNFSPDGRYLVFNRYIDVCRNHLWAKDLDENREFRLTTEAGFYGPAAWSPDGTQLAFTRINQCQSQIEKGCRNLSALSFLLAKNQPQSPREVLACDQQTYGGINWLSNDDIVFIEREGRSSQVQTLSLASGRQRTLFQHETLVPQALTYSHRNALLAITALDPLQQTAVVLYDTQTQTSNQFVLKVPDDYRYFLGWDPSWHPFDDTLWASLGSSLFEISLNGEMTEHPVSTVADLYNPMYHPSEDKMVMVVGGVDRDIEEHHFSLPADANAGQTLTREVLHTSTVEDFLAKYQPDSGNISFISNRSGEEQIWLSQVGDLKQLSRFPANTRIDSYVWSGDGKSILLAMKGALHLLTSDGQSQKLKLPFMVNDVYQWLDGQRVLLAVKTQGSVEEVAGRQVVLVDVATGMHQTLRAGGSRWAQLDASGRLFYIDEDNTIYRQGEGEAQVYPPLQDHHVASGFMIKQGGLVFFDQQLWRYDFASQALTSIQPGRADFPLAQLSDADFSQHRALFSIYKDFQKDLVMFER